MLRFDTAVVFSWIAATKSSTFVMRWSWMSSLAPRDARALILHKPTKGVVSMLFLGIEYRGARGVGSTSLSDEVHAGKA